MSTLLRADSRRAFLKDLGLLPIFGAGHFFRARPVMGWDEAGQVGALVVHTDVPRNAEPPLDRLVQSWLTPVDAFFIRSHGPTPQVDPAAYRLSVEGLVEKPLRMALDQLRQTFPSISTLATLTCAGNRRSEHSLVKPVAGVPWREGAIGNARWEGVRLSDVLKAARVKPDARHVWFEGLDRIDHEGTTISFGGSIPLEKAFADADHTPGALIADRMNDRPLTADHGFPLRMVVPGYIGARSVKWLQRIVVSDRPSPNHFVADVYKIVEEDTPLEVAETAPLYRFPINSAICVPQAGARLAPGCTTVRGYALPPGNGAAIARVEVSADRGRTWREAAFASDPKPYCWVLWRADVPVAADTAELVVRASDSRGTVQPRRVAWNVKGYLYNAWHRVAVEVRS